MLFDYYFRVKLQPYIKGVFFLQTSVSIHVKEYVILLTPIPSVWASCASVVSSENAQMCSVFTVRARRKSGGQFHIWTGSCHNSSQVTIIRIARELIHTP